MRAMAIFMKVLLLVGFSCVGNMVADGCPFWNCLDEYYDSNPLTLDYSVCVDKVNATWRCLQTGLKQSDVCEKCQKWDFTDNLRDEWVPDQINYNCYKKQCKREKLQECFYHHMRNTILYYDTSEIDDMISCIDKWSPELDSRTCVKIFYFSLLPDHIDPVAVGKQLLLDMKEGCDLVLPFLECRTHFAPLDRSVRYTTEIEFQKQGKIAVQKTVDCVANAVKKYPCKTLEALLSSAANRAVFVEEMIRKYTYRRPRPEPISPYQVYCGNGTGGYS